MGNYDSDNEGALQPMTLQSKNYSIIRPEDHAHADDTGVFETSDGTQVLNRANREAEKGAEFDFEDKPAKREASFSDILKNNRELEYFKV